MEMEKSMRKDPTSAPQAGAASSEAAKTTETVNSELTDKEQTEFLPVLRLGRCSRQ
jgi:hypothetical protein